MPPAVLLVTGSDGNEPPRVLFLGSVYAGHRTRFEQLRAHTEHDPRFQATYRSVSGWVNGGWIERLPGPRELRGRVRALVQARHFASLPRPDVLWTSVHSLLGPYAWAQLGPMRRPLVFDMDDTFELRQQLVEAYWGHPPRAGVHRRLLRLQEQLIFRTVTLFTPWSQWAADSLRRSGVAEDRIRVIPPGVDLDRWRPQPKPQSPGEGPLRLLFVGGDFERKGGDLLLEVVAGPLAGRCELDIVTREAVRPAPGVRVHRAEAGDPLLQRLYRDADVFVLPSHAEMFGIAAVEALASGTPAVVSAVGGGREIVTEGETGWVVQPTADDLAALLGAVADQPAQLAAMGRAARLDAERRFDGAANDRRVADAILDAWRQGSSR